MLRAGLKFLFLLFGSVLSQPLLAQTELPPKIDLTEQQDYILKRVSSSDPSGGTANLLG